MLSHMHKLAVYCFVDCDHYGFTNIYRTLKVGSGNAAHVNRFLCMPQALFLGVDREMGSQLRDQRKPAEEAR